MSYRVRLNKAALNSGRQFVRSFLTRRESNFDIAAGTPEVLHTFLVRAEYDWGYFSTFLEERKAAAPRENSAACHMLQAAVTSVTVAAEMVSENHWLLATEYAPELYIAFKATDGERQFIHDAKRVLSLMGEMINVLLSWSASNPPCPGERDTAQDIFLDYALHLAELGLRICIPEGFSRRNPQAETWLRRRARVLRASASVCVQLARGDESRAAESLA